MKGIYPRSDQPDILAGKLRAIRLYGLQTMSMMPAPITAPRSRMMKHRPFVALLTLALSTTAAAASRDLQPGLWEITTDTSMPGLPVQMAPLTRRNCYTAADLAEAQNAVRQGGYANCVIQHFREQGNTASWAIECSGEPAMRGSGTMTTTATSFIGSMDSVVNYPGGAVRLTNRWRARRVGECK
jgi:hypothetical protein